MLGQRPGRCGGHLRYCRHEALGGSNRLDGGRVSSFPTGYPFLGSHPPPDTGWGFNPFGGAARDTAWFVNAECLARGFPRIRPRSPDSPQRRAFQTIGRVETHRPEDFRDHLSRAPDATSPPHRDRLTVTTPMGGGEESRTFSGPVMTDRTPEEGALLGLLNHAANGVPPDRDCLDEGQLGGKSIGA